MIAGIAPAAGLFFHAGGGPPLSMRTDGYGGSGEAAMACAPDPPTEVT